MTKPEVKIKWLGGNCPVQAEGEINGQPFYFRARGEHWSLEIGECQVDGPDPDAPWRYEEPWGDGPYDAGWMDEKTAREMIARGAEMWAAAQV
jgi:hypothetical protein